MENTFFYFFLISVFFFGSLTIGPLSVRVIMCIITLCLLFVHHKKLLNVGNLSNNLILLYCCFLVCMSIAMYFNGEFDEYGVIKVLLAFHLVCIVSYYAIRYYVNSNNTINIVSIILITAIILNSVVTILQYIGNPLGWGINLAITDARNEMVVRFSGSVSEGQTLLGIAKTPGLLDSAVANGMFISSLGVIPFIYLSKIKDVKSKISKTICWCSIGLSSVACFMCQERAALLMFVAALLYLLWNQIKNKLIIVIAFTIGIIYFALTPTYDISGLGRFTDFSVGDDLRSNIWNTATTFISDNLMWGGPLHFLKIAGHFPHNFFFNALIYGGLIGGLFIIVLFIIIVIKVIKSIRRGNSSEEIVYATALLVYLMQGMFHNASLVTGSVTIFVLLGLMEASKEISENQENSEDLCEY